MNLVNIGSVSMTSQEISDLVDKRHDSVKRTIETLADQGVISQPQIVNGEKSANGVVPRLFLFAGEQGKRDSIIVVAQLSPEFTARLVDRWQELEQRLTPALPNFANPAEAARAWAEQYEARLIAERTKAEIGTRREATAMNTASQAVKRVNQLEIAIDESKRYSSIKRMEMLYHGQKFSWKILKDTSAEMEIAPKKIFDANYGTVNTYHADVWREAYALEIL